MRISHELFFVVVYEPMFKAVHLLCLLHLDLCIPHALLNALFCFRASALQSRTKDFEGGWTDEQVIALQLYLAFFFLSLLPQNSRGTFCIDIQQANPLQRQRFTDFIDVSTIEVPMDFLIFKEFALCNVLLEFILAYEVVIDPVLFARTRSSSSARDGELHFIRVLFLE